MKTTYTLFLSLVLLSASGAAEDPKTSPPAIPTVSASSPQPGDADFPAPSECARHTQKVAALQAGNYDLFLIGDSITQTVGDADGEWEPLKAVWDRHFAPRNAINLGYSGYRTENILWNLANGELDQARSPKVAVLLIGTNNTDDEHYPRVHTAEQVFAGTKAIVELIRQRHPQTRILILRIFSCGGVGDQTAYHRKYNRSAKALAATRRAGELTRQLADGKQVFWLDVNHVFLCPDGTINTNLMPDLIHPNAAGAEAWAQAIEPTLAQLMGPGTKPGLPGSELNLRLAAPIKTWDEALPLGNGTMGVLLWGETNRLRLSLDRGDLWDERPSKRFTQVRDKFNWATMQQLVASNRMAEFNDIYDSNYDYNGQPTKLPAGRVEITLEPSQTVAAFELNLATAEGVASFKGGGAARAFVNAAAVNNPVALVRIDGPPLKDVQLKMPDSVKLLGYPPPRVGEGEGLRWFEQEAADGFSYAICAGWKRAGNTTLLAVTVSTRGEGKSPEAVAKRRVEAALAAGYDQLLAEHAKWWVQFWERSQVSVPESHILQHYYLVRYFYGAASRRGAPPMPLQGVWSADAGSLPPWKGDYHNDLNTQMTYIAYRTAGNFDEGLCFLDYLWDRLPTFRQFAKDFYGAPGAAVPGVMSLAGQPLGGWGQYSLSPTMGAWNAHLFYLHWRHTGDAAFLRNRAYPFCREIGTCLRALLKPDTNGVLVLPLSSSPEIFDNSHRAFLKPNSNYDLASLRMLFLALAEMAAATGDQPAAADWAAAAKQLGPFHAKPDGTLLLDETTPLPDSHRHLSNLMPLHPFNLLTADGGERERQVITASLKDWDGKGTGAWCGYSFSWMACLRARVGDAEPALRNLDTYARAFILRNGFHANGDQTGSGFSGFTYRPFTLEGNFLAMEAVHEMLLQSWSAQPGSGDWGVIRIFPATPWRWHDASFEDLRAEGGHRVSARREHNATVWLRIVAGSEGVVKIRNNFGGREPKWSREGVKQVGDNFEIPLRRGEAVEATLPKPAQPPPEPANAAKPVVIRH